MKTRPKTDRALLVVLVGLTLAVYWRAQGYQFVHLDDLDYVVYNFPLRGGFSLANIEWAFTTTRSANWHPLTWLSHMADVALFGLDPGWHHRVNIALHLLNTALLYLALRGMTGSASKSGFVAALFGVHPLHVESVAWIAERKDLLCACFWMLTLWAYGKYAARGGWVRYLAVVLFFSLGLLAKPMAVTLPFVLLLLDFWPLGRVHPPGAAPGAPSSLPQVAGRLVLEKLPLFALAALSCAVTYFVQREGAAISGFPLGVRFENALVSYLAYLAKMAWPASLAVYYPHPASVSAVTSAARAVGALLVLGGISVFAAVTLRKHPFFGVGWFWYLGTLVPVIGLVQVGSQALADRYTYLPLIGAFIVVAWGVPVLLGGWRRRERALWAGGVSVVLALSLVAWFQVASWKDSFSLFGHALRVTEDNWMALELQGIALAERGDLAAGIASVREALRIKPGHVPALISLGSLLSQAALPDEAEVHLGQAVRREPRNALAHYNLAVVLAGRGRDREATREYLETLRLNPDHAYAHNNVGDILLRQGSREQALEHFREALRLDPGDPIAAANLEKALAGSTR
jgi:tetratricopeptide (TPR) repeat protein